MEANEGIDLGSGSNFTVPDETLDRDRVHGSQVDNNRIGRESGTKPDVQVEDFDSYNVDVQEASKKLEMDRVCKPGIGFPSHQSVTLGECYSEIVDSSKLSPQVLVKEFTVIVDHGGANTKPDHGSLSTEFRVTEMQRLLHSKLEVTETNVSDENTQQLDVEINKGDVSVTKSEIGLSTNVEDPKTVDLTVVISLLETDYVPPKVDSTSHADVIPDPIDMGQSVCLKNDQTDDVVDGVKTDGLSDASDSSVHNQNSQVDEECSALKTTDTIYEDSKPPAIQTETVQIGEVLIMEVGVTNFKGKVELEDFAGETVVENNEVFDSNCEGSSASVFGKNVTIETTLGGIVNNQDSDMDGTDENLCYPAEDQNLKVNADSDMMQNEDVSKLHVEVSVNDDFGQERNSNENVRPVHTDLDSSVKNTKSEIQVDFSIINSKVPSDSNVEAVVSGNNVSIIHDSMVDSSDEPQTEPISDSLINMDGRDDEFLCLVPDKAKELEGHLVSNEIFLPYGNHTENSHDQNIRVFHEVENQVVNGKNEASEADENCSMGTLDPEVVHLHSGHTVSDYVVINENIDGSDEIHRMGSSERFSLYAVQDSGAGERITDTELSDLHGQHVGSEEHGTIADLTVGHEMEDEIDVMIDTEEFDCHEENEMQGGQYSSGFEQPNCMGEKIVVQEAEVEDHFFYFDPSEVEADDHVLTDCESEFGVSDLVWGKVRSHPWWPGQIFDPSDSSEQAIKHYRKDCYLVAYFGDQTFAWNESSLLKPFHTHFSQIENHGGSDPFQNAISCALDEISRRVELGLSCSCVPDDLYDKIKYQTVHNAGIREESSIRFDVNKSKIVNSFEPMKLMEYINSLARFPTGEGDKLELVIATAQLLALNHLRGYSQLPEFEYCEDLLGNVADMRRSNDQMHYNDSMEVSTYSFGEDGITSSGNGGELKGQIVSSHKRKHNLKDSMYPRKKRIISELMDVMPYSPNSDDVSERKYSSKFVSSPQGKKYRALDSFSDDLANQDLKKNNLVAKTSQTTSFNVGACISRVASQMTRSPSVLKSSGDKIVGPNFEISIHNPDDMGNMVVPVESSSPYEMLAQLDMVARGPMEGYSFLNSLATFFYDYRNYIVSSGRENLCFGKSSSGRKRKSINGAPETFDFEDMNDSYWTDRVIQNSSEDQPPRRGRKRKVEYQSSIAVPEGSFLYGNHEVFGVRPTQDLSATELILNFSELNCVPTETYLTKMFRRFGSLRESETEIDRLSSRARVVFKRCSDAEVAFSSARIFNIFGSTAVNYELSYSPSISFKSSPLAITEGQEDANYCLHAEDFSNLEASEMGVKSGNL